MKMKKNTKLNPFKTQKIQIMKIYHKQIWKK